MPIHDYTCARCGHLIEVIHGIHEGGPRFCPSCGAEGTMRRGFSAPAIHFKGSGWAKKDRSATSAPGRSRPSKPADDAGSASGGGTSSGTGEASTSASDTSASAAPSPDGGD